MTTQIEPLKIKFYTTLGFAGQDINDLKPMPGALAAMPVDAGLYPIGGDMMRHSPEKDSCSC